MKTALPNRVFNSPLIEYANFEGGKVINLIRIKKPYANGASFAIYQNMDSNGMENKMFKSYELAKLNFDVMVVAVQIRFKFINGGKTLN